MGRKRKYTIEEKIQAVLDYKKGIRGKAQRCNDLGLFDQAQIYIDG